MKIWKVVFELKDYAFFFFFFFFFFFLSQFFFFFAEFKLLKFHNNIMKISEKMKSCLQVTYPTDFYIIGIHFYYGKKWKYLNYTKKKKKKKKKRKDNDYNKCFVQR